MRYFNLPRVIGTDAAGEVITADIGKYGPYIKCGNEFRSVKTSSELFEISEEQARVILSTPKESSKKAAASGKTAAAAPARRSNNAQAVVDFGDYEGQNLGIYHGKYGYYLRHGDKNIRIAKEYQKDEEACKSMTKETAVSFLK